jgi:hypothetical protein
MLSELCEWRKGDDSYDLAVAESVLDLLNNLLYNCEEAKDLFATCGGTVIRLIDFSASEN